MRWRKENPGISPAGVLKLGGIGASGEWFLSALILPTFIGIPFYFIFIELGLAGFERFPTIVANVIVISIASFLARVSVDEETGDPLIRMRDAYRVEISILVAALTTGAAILEIARASTRQAPLSTILVDIHDDLLWGAGAFLLGFLALHLVQEELKYLQGRVSLVLGKVFFSSSVGIYAWYTASTTGAFDRLDLLLSDAPVSPDLAIPLWLAFTLIAACTGAEGIKEARLLIHWKTRGMLRKRIGQVILTLLLLMFGSVLWSCSWITLAPEQQVKIRDAIVGPPIEINESVSKASTEPSREEPLALRDWVFLAPNDSRHPLKWGAEAFDLGSVTKLTSEREIRDLTISPTAMKIICESRIVIVGAGASASGLKAPNDKIARARTEGLGSLFWNAVRDNRTSTCHSTKVQVYVLNLGFFQPEDGIPDRAEQRRPFVITVDSDLEDLQVDIERLAEALSEEVLNAAHEGPIPDLCYADYTDAHIYKFLPDQVDPHVWEVDFSPGPICSVRMDSNQYSSIKKGSEK